MGYGELFGGGWGAYDEVKTYTWCTRLKGVLTKNVSHVDLTHYKN